MTKCLTYDGENVYWEELSSSNHKYSISCFSPIENSKAKLRCGQPLCDSPTS